MSCNLPTTRASPPELLPTELRRLPASHDAGESIHRQTAHVRLDDRFCRRTRRAQRLGAADEREERQSSFSGCKTALARRLRFVRSEEHTSELQSRLHLVCRLL